MQGTSFKQVKTVETGQSTVTEHASLCNGCGKNFALDTQNHQCSGCKSVKYCDSTCQKRHWKTHKVLCQAIQSLHQESVDKCKKACEFTSHITPKQKNNIAKLVGEKCMVDCRIAGSEDSALLDTGAQVSLTFKRWLIQRGIRKEIRDIKELLDEKANLTLSGVNGSDIPYEGYVNLDVEVGGKMVEVPFLVTKQDIQSPIIGYNAIKKLVCDEAEEKDSIEVVKELFRKSDKVLDDQSVSTLVATLQSSSTDMLSAVKIRKQGEVLKAGSVTTISCKIDSLLLEERTPAVFEPEIEELLPEGIQAHTTLVHLKKGISSKIMVTVVNTNTRDVFLDGRLQIGEIHLVNSVTPVEVKEMNFEEVGGGERGSGDENEYEPSQEKLEENNVKVGALNVNEKREDDEKRMFEEIDKMKSLSEEGGKYWKEIMEMDVSRLTMKEQNQARKMLWARREAFTIDEKEIGCAEELKMSITTEDEKPVQQAYNNIPRPLMDEVKNHVEDLLNRQWITRSKSAWSSPMVLVRKKDGSLRLCCDFRRLNKKTIPDKHPLPRVQASLDSLGGSKWFSVLDQSRAYYQGFIAEEDRHKTAFATPWGLYQWVRIPFGLTNAPATFQRFMEETVGDFRDKFAIPYLDDVIVHSGTFTDHLTHIDKMLERIIERGLKLNPRKCKFFQSSVKFLGRVVDGNGYRMDDSSIEAVVALKSMIPQNVGDIRHVLGLLGYHRRHIQDFSRRAKPISDLLLETRSEKSSKKQKVVWSDACKSALESLITDISAPPILSYPDFDKEFILHTDASGYGLGAILYQKQDEKMCVIGYGSRTLNKSESKYHATKLEFLALKWAVTEVFHDYLGYSNHFWAFTDNNPLVYLMEAKKLNAYGERWVSELAEYNFTIKYRPGVINRDADCLSRLPLDVGNYMELCTEEVPPDSFQAIMCGVEVKVRGEETWRLRVNNVNTKDVGEIEVLPENISQNISRIRDQQEKDAEISEVMRCLKESSMKVMLEDSYEVKVLKRCAKKLRIDKEGILRRSDKTYGKQIVLPKSMRPLIYQHLHIDMGHLGADRVFELARKKVYWPRMQDDIESFIRDQCTCIAQRKPHLHSKAPLQNITTTSPMELVTINYVHLEKGIGGMEYILVIVDHFTRFTQAYPTKNKSSLTAAKRLYNDFILRFGIPSQFLTDQGGEFENNLMRDLNKICGITKIRTTPYHPQTNGACERMNQTLLKMLRTLPESMKSRWPESVNKMVHAYNCTRHSSTGYSPFFLLFGRDPTLPIDLLLCTDSNTVRNKNHGKFVKDWKRQMEEAYKLAQERSGSRKLKDKERWDAGATLSCLKVGDRVLVQNKEKGGPGKLRSYWEQQIYVITSVKG